MGVEVAATVGKAVGATAGFSCALGSSDTTFAFEKGVGAGSTAVIGFSSHTFGTSRLLELPCCPVQEVATTIKNALIASLRYILGPIIVF